MSLTNENGMIMPVSPMYGNGGGSWGGFGGDGSWWVILFLFALLGGFGNGFGGYGGGGGAVPFINNDVQRGFDQSAIMSGITGIQSAVTSGFGDVQTALCGGFAGVNAGIANGFAQSEIADNARQIANLQQSFASQTAITSGLTSLSAQLSQCLKKVYETIMDAFGFTGYEAVGTLAA